MKIHKQFFYPAEKVDWFIWKFISTMEYKNNKKLNCNFLSHNSEKKTSELWDVISVYKLANQRGKDLLRVYNWSKFHSDQLRCLQENIANDCCFSFYPPKCAVTNHQCIKEVLSQLYHSLISWWPCLHPQLSGLLEPLHHVNIHFKQ